MLEAGREVKSRTDPQARCSYLNEKRANSYAVKGGMLVRSSVLAPYLRIRRSDFTKRFAEHPRSIGKLSSLYSDNPDRSFDLAVRKCERRNSGRDNPRRDKTRYEANSEPRPNHRNDTECTLRLNAWMELEPGCGKYSFEGSPCGGLGWHRHQGLSDDVGQANPFPQGKFMSVRYDRYKRVLQKHFKVKLLGRPIKRDDCKIDSTLRKPFEIPSIKIIQQSDFDRRPALLELRDGVRKEACSDRW